MSIESVMPSNHLILCRPLLFLPSSFPSIRVFSSELTLHIRWPNYWSFSFSPSPSNEYSGLISFRMDWLHLLTVQGTLSSLFQHPSTMLFLSVWCWTQSGTSISVLCPLTDRLERGRMDVARVALGKPGGPEWQWHCPSAQA